MDRGASTDPTARKLDVATANAPADGRAQTDESLRTERAKTDERFDEEGGEADASIDETADAVVAKARVRADAVLASARAEIDRRRAAPRPAGIAAQREIEDAVLERERASADEAVLGERAALADSLAAERELTDRDLETERSRSDHEHATREAYVAIIGHDLRNLLHSMNGFAALIATRAPELGDPAEVVAFAQRIRRAGGRMNRLIGDLVDVATSQKGILQVTRELADPSEIVTEVVEAMQPQASARRLSLTAEIAGSTSPASFDPPRMLQLLTNLVSNAIKFTPPEGKVIVRLERDTEELRFIVRDTGSGIPADKLDVIFERFIQVQQGDRRGYGLGLYIAQCIVRGHGGRIWAESVIGEGSTITAALPLDATMT